MPPPLVEDEGLVVPDWADWPMEPELAYVAAEMGRCSASPRYFIDTYCSVYQAGEFDDSDEEEDEEAFIDPTEGGGGWVRFRLWDSQLDPLYKIHRRRKSIHLKARQLGMTWLCLAYVLWMKLFRREVVALLFSRRDTESLDLMRRLQNMFRRLPAWLVPEGSFRRGRLAGAAGHSWTMANGSRSMAFPTSAGDSYTASIAVVDEADLAPDLNRLLGSVKPTVDSGGKLVLLSRSDKAKPESPFKAIYRAARSGENNWAYSFLPWYARPERTRKWYRDQVRDSLSTTFSLDAVWEQYPNTDDEALAPRQLDKRFPMTVMAGCFKTAADLCHSGTVVPVLRWREFSEDVDAAGRVRRVPTVPAVLLAEPVPTIPGLRLYKLPKLGRAYTIGADPAQGLANSHDSAAVVVDDDTGEEVAAFWGKIAPKPFARYLSELCTWYRKVARCRLMCERNNHGHAVIGFFREFISTHFQDAGLALGPDGGVGWNQGEQSQELMFHRAAACVSEKKCVIHTRLLYDQVCDVEAETLHAPEGRLDDLAYAWGLAMAGGAMKRKMSW